MRPIRRTHDAPRLELVPILDVVFLLLAFFIYSAAVMIRADLLPVSFVALTGAGPTPPSAAPDAIEITRAGTILFNREPLRLEDLPARLAKIRKASDQPKVYLATEAQSQTDRLPMFLAVLGQIRAAGVQPVLVGPPRQEPPRSP